jgi:pimeloyl-ACP methyl ester carboxylesterase
MYREHLINTGRVTLNYWEGPSNGPPLLCLHGLTTSWQLFLPIAPLLSTRWHVYALDFRGHGKSGHVPGSYSVRDYGLDVLDLIAQRFSEPVALLGHSLGGGVALWVASQAPQLIRAVIVEDTSPFPDALRHSLFPSLFQALKDLLVAGRSIESLRSGLSGLEFPSRERGSSMRYGQNPDMDPTLIRFFAKALSQLDVSTLDCALDIDRFFAGIDVPAALALVLCPVLLLRADPNRGGLLNDEDAGIACRIMSDAICIPVESAGHFLHLDQPEKVGRLITFFLESL